MGVLSGAAILAFSFLTSLHSPSMFAIKANIYIVLYEQSGSIAFDETSSYWSAPKNSSNFLVFHWSPHGSLVSIGQLFVATWVVYLPKTSLITKSDLITSYCSYARPAQPGPIRTRLCGLCIAVIAGSQWLSTLMGKNFFLLRGNSFIEGFYHPRKQTEIHKIVSHLQNGNNTWY